MAADRTPLIAGNWKMHKTSTEAVAFLGELLPRLEGVAGVETMVCPPSIALPAVAELARAAGVRVGAQNMHEAESGAYTGEVSAAMLLDSGADAVILGHSERRELFGETDEALARKLPAALGAGLTPILCVGESEAQRDRGETEDVLERQVVADLAAVGDEQLGDVVLAYEPIWAIGTGRNATPGQAQEAIAAIRSLIARRSQAAAPAARILYGGSVNSDNAAELLAQPDVDGALVGGASLDPDGFAAIVRSAARP